MSQHRLRVPESEGLGHKRTSSEDNLYLAVLRASEGKKGSGLSPLGRKGPIPAAGSLAPGGGGAALRGSEWRGRACALAQVRGCGSGGEAGSHRCMERAGPSWQGWQWPLDLGYRALVGGGSLCPGEVHCPVGRVQLPRHTPDQSSIPAGRSFFCSRLQRWCVGVGPARTCSVGFGCGCQLWTLPSAQGDNTGIERGTLCAQHPRAPTVGAELAGGWAPDSLPVRWEGAGPQRMLLGPSGVSAWWSPPGGSPGFSLATANPVLSFPDERDRVQKKTFTKWVNKHLIKVGGACACVCGCGWRGVGVGVGVEGGCPWPSGQNKGCPHRWPGSSPFISETCYFLSLPCPPPRCPCLLSLPLLPLLLLRALLLSW